jgi:7-cyano-7-deazaguanine synthase
MDSAACLDFYLQGGFVVSGLFVDYGQAARMQERRSAGNVANHYGIELRSLSIAGGGGHSGGLVMGRNAFLLFAALMESNLAFDLIVTGVHAGTQYYDCSSSFINAIQAVFDGYTCGRVTIGAPFLEWSKLDIFGYSQNRKVPISMTYSCEAGSETPCGRCLSCRDMEVLRAR